MVQHCKEMQRRQAAVTLGRVFNAISLTQFKAASIVAQLVKSSFCYCAGDLGSIPGLGRSPGEGKGYALQYSGLENSKDCIDHGGHKESDTTEQLSLSPLMALTALHVFSRFLDLPHGWTNE